jgi:hypothetical protein
MIQVHIKPMPGYAQHTRGHFQFLAGAREAADTRKSGHPDPITGRVMYIVEGGREIIVDPRATRDVDESGKPLVITMKSYELLREVSGHSLVIEPIGDDSRDIEAMAKKIAGARVAALELDLKKAKDDHVTEVASLTEQLEDAHAQIAKFEKALASVK